MTNKIVNKSVSFNLLDPAQRELFEYAAAKTTNFSGYMKRILAREKEGGGQQRYPEPPDQDQVCDKNNVRGLI